MATQPMVSAKKQNKTKKNENLMYLPLLEKVSRKDSSDMEEKTEQENNG